MSFEVPLKIGVDVPAATTAVLVKLRNGPGQFAEAGVDAWRLARTLAPSRLSRAVRRISPAKWIWETDRPWRDIIKATLLVGMSTAFLWVFSRIWISGSHYVNEPSRAILTTEILLMSAVLFFGLCEFGRHLSPARRRARSGGSVDSTLRQRSTASPSGARSRSDLAPISFDRHQGSLRNSPRSRSATTSLKRRFPTGERESTRKRAARRRGGV